MASSVTTAARATTQVAKDKVKTAMGKNYHEYSWDELEAIEKRRRRILKRSDDPFFSILAQWDGTVLDQLFHDALFWITILIYAGVRVWARIGIPDYVADLGSGDIAVIGGFTSFFLVFFVNQSNARYFSLYDKSMACKGRIFDVASIAVTNLPRNVATRLIRYMNAANVAGYTGLSETYPADSFFSQMNKNLGLLTDDELARMKDIDLDKGGSCQREMIAWCMKEIATLQKEGIVDNELAAQLRDQILQLRAAFGALFNAADLPIPFFYVHFICLLSAFYLPLFAISAAYAAGSGSDVYWTSDVVAGLVVVLQAIFVIGLRILGQKMSDPYGDDLIDLSVIFYCNFTWRMSNRILNAQFPPNAASERVEKNLIRDRNDSIGNAFETDSFHTINSDPNYDENGLSINQLQDGTEQHEYEYEQKGRFWFHRGGE